MRVRYKNLLMCDAPEPNPILIFCNHHQGSNRRNSYSPRPQFLFPSPECQRCPTWILGVNHISAKGAVKLSSVARAALCFDLLGLKIIDRGGEDTVQEQEQEESLPAPSFPIPLYPSSRRDRDGHCGSTPASLSAPAAPI